MKLNSYTYRLPFVRPFRTAGETYTHRQGIILEAEEGDIYALGEAAPLPGFSRETFTGVKKQAEQIGSLVLELLDNEATIIERETCYKEHNIAPSLRFAIDTLASGYLAQKAGRSLADFLFENHQPAVKINEVISLLSQDEAMARVNRAVTDGFDTLKLKVGPGFENIPSLLRQIRSDYPKLTIRIDANGSWELDEAIRNLGQLEEFDLEYCEEPLADPAPDALEELTSATGVPLALDESLLQSDHPEELLPFTSACILKPMAIGSFSNLFATKALADTHDNKTVLTTSLESGIGRHMTAILASGLGSPSTAHGLHTGGLLKIDVWNDGTYINNGCFTLPDLNGMGKRRRPEIQSIALTKTELHGG